MAKKSDHVELRGIKLLVCSGGPRDRAWYTLAFWERCRVAAIHDGEKPHEGRTLGYMATTATQDHPRIPGLFGTVLRWNPDKVAELDAETGQ